MIVNTELWNFYHSQTGATGTLSDLENLWLAQQVGHGGTTNDLWMEYLGGLGYTGTFNDRLNAYGGPTAIPSWLTDLSSDAVMGWDFRTNRRFGMSNGGFTRSSSALMADADGVYHSFASNVLRRIDDVGALLEVAATNLLLNSNALDQAAWNILTNTTVSTVVGADPFGNENSFRITASGSDSVFGQSCALSAGTQVTMSAFVKTDGMQNTLAAKLRRGSTMAAFASTDITSEVTWERVTTTGTLPSGETSVQSVLGGGSSFSTGETILAAGWQLEVGSKATSPIITTGTTATRSADSLTLTLSQSGSYAIKALLSDDSVQTLNASAEDDFIINPANLNKPGIKAIWAE